MNVKELIKELEKRVSQGYGDKPIYVEDRQKDFNIDSVQKNTHSDVEPDYLFIMAGEPVSEEEGE